MMAQIFASRRVCVGCGLVVDGPALYPRCPRAGDGGDHVLVRELVERHLKYGIQGDLRYPDRPFLRWRERLHAWHLARGAGWSDESFVELVDRLDQRVQAIDGRGFRVTPLVPAQALAARLELPGALYVKDETGNVAGSHKARHLFSILLAMEVLGVDRARPLAVAGGDQSALAAATLAAAARRKLHVYLAPDASQTIVKRLSELGATSITCARSQDSNAACLDAFREAVRGGALPFTTHGPDNGLAIEGGETLGWEIVHQLDHTALDRASIQVGGGALGASVGRALQQAVRVGALPRMPRLHAIQARGAWPLARCYERIAREVDGALGLRPSAPREDDMSSASVAYRLRRADRIATSYAEDVVQHTLRQIAARRNDVMWPWEEAPCGSARGILEAETQDWLALVHAMFEGGGVPFVVEEPLVRHANKLALETTGIAADEAATAGLAGLMLLHETQAIEDGETSLVLFSSLRH